MTTSRPSLTLCLALLVGASGGCLAQSAPEPKALEQRVERIHVEDTSSRIDELRVGGETRTITVSPKGGMPAYEVLPSSANRNPSAGERNSVSASGGTRVWKILGF